MWGCHYAILVERVRCSPLADESYVCVCVLQPRATNRHQPGPLLLGSVQGIFLLDSFESDSATLSGSNYNTGRWDPARLLKMTTFSEIVTWGIATKLPDGEGKDHLKQRVGKGFTNLNGIGCELHSYIHLNLANLILRKKTAGWLSAGRDWCRPIWQCGLTSGHFWWMMNVT